MVKIRTRSRKNTQKTWVRLTHRAPIELAEGRKLRKALALLLFEGVEPSKELAMTTLSILIELANQKTVEEALRLLIDAVDEQRLAAALRECEFQVE